MLTVHLHALPPPHGRHYEQALIDHFFIDIEDHIRTILQPPAQPTTPYTFHTSFYLNPNTPSPDAVDKDGKPKLRSWALDKIVMCRMKIFKEQWAGMRLSLDLGLVKGDQELAGAVWQNLLSTHGIIYDSSTPFCRSVNLVGSEVVNVAKLDLEKEMREDGSGVHDFPPTKADKYLTYPEAMLDVVWYVRRELKRLELVSDDDIIGGDWEKLKFGVVQCNR